MTTTATTNASTSTTVRASSRAQLIALRAAFAVLDRVAPPLAARWALDIWCTLPKGSGRRRDARPSEGVRADLTTAPGRRLAVEVWGEGPPVYLAHGWGGWRGQMGAFVTPLVESGHRVVAFDAPGHGDSDPGALGRRRGNAAEFAQALGQVIEAQGPAAGVVAHSLGGATAALAVRDGAPVSRLALIGASPDPIGMTDTLSGLLGYGERTKGRFLARLEELARRPLADFDLTSVSRVAADTLIVHDRQDKEVPYAEGARLAEAWLSAELVTTTGLGHQRILADPTVIERVRHFVTS
ncbi:alpha/beta fold hydrolase [Pengzhenrongella sp.]|jgi:pimeloyl-ACP methyl ester carboxylesterase|uniref:alpha/beta fold hydrolase n=1 Tax=Pengzhenrongella sp. TaxID=2888820 RepID=UPI002F935FC3